MSFEEFQDGHHGGHLGNRNGTILEILNLYVAPLNPRPHPRFPLKVSAQSDMVWEEMYFD